MSPQQGNMCQWMRARHDTVAWHWRRPPIVEPPLAGAARGADGSAVGYVARRPAGTAYAMAGQSIHGTPAAPMRRPSMWHRQHEREGSGRYYLPVPMHVSRQ